MLEYTIQPTNADAIWFYENNGQRMGGLPESQIIEMINNRALDYGNLVWKSGFPEWIKIENTELRLHLEKVAPPPITGSHVNNSIVWILAFAPILALWLEYIFAGLINSDHEYLIDMAMQNNDYWYIGLILNVALSFWDVKLLKKLGTDTTLFKGWAVLIPIYLFRRAKALKQNNAYFIVWVICFFVSMGFPFLSES